MGAEDGRKLPSREDLVHEHLDALHGLALAWTRDGDWARDLVQRTFLKAFERVGQLRAPEAARSWLITILRHERATDLRQQAKFEVLREEPADEDPGDGEDGLDPHLLQALPAALDCLQDSHREILLLRFQQDLSYESIGASLEIPIGTVMSRLHRAKTQLRRLLEALYSSTSGGLP